MSGSMTDHAAQLLSAFPGLNAVWNGAHGEALRAELQQLLSHVYPSRAPRKPVSVIAKLVRNLQGCEVEESVVVHDVSESGMRVTVPSHVGLSLSEALSATFVLRFEASVSILPELEGSRRLSARCVRIVGSNAVGIELAYVFEGLSAAEREHIYTVTQWNTPRPSKAPAGERHGRG